MKLEITKIVLTKTQTAFLETPGKNGVNVVTGTPEAIGALFEKYEHGKCQIVFDTYAAPNFNRCFNAFTKRAERIADAAGVTLSPPAEYFIDGHRQVHKFVMTVCGPQNGQESAEEKKSQNL
jgi:predicted deacylase